MYLSGLRSLGTFGRLPRACRRSARLPRRRSSRLHFGSDAVAGDCCNPMPGHRAGRNRLQAPGGDNRTSLRRGIARPCGRFEFLGMNASVKRGGAPHCWRRLPVRVPKTSSELMTSWNRLSWRNDWVACYVWAVLASPFKSKLLLEAENAAFRHHLTIFEAQASMVASGSRT
jgi:hypothetical protein